MLAAVIIYLLLGLTLILMARQRQRQKLRNIAAGLIVTWLTIGLIIGVGEAYFRFAYAASDTPMQWTLAGKNWIERYMQMNSLGYRDREWTPAELNGKTVIFAVGDSFTEGWGIENPAARFPDRLQTLLGSEYAVVNLGKGGSSTLHQTQFVMDYPHATPDVILWQYLLNDIDVAAISNGLTWDSPIPLERPALIEESHLVNFIYWRLFRQGMFNSPQGIPQWEWLYGAYDDSYIWDIHADEISRMAEYADSVGARLITVIFPNMEDPVRSIGYVDRVAQHLESLGQTEILKVTDLAASMPIEERLVSRADAHPSAAFNGAVADAIYARFFEP
jgi:hypothetical protein